MREAQRMKLFRSKVGKAEKESNRRSYICMKRGCANKAIKSHSQQKMCQLASIAEDSWVYSIDKGLYQMFSGKPREILVKKTITESSRYKGYCNGHDTEIFSEIENDNLDVSLAKHNLLLLLRCVSYEVANKRDAYLRQQDLLEHAGELMSWDGRKNYEASGFGMRLFLEKDAPYYFELLDQIESSGCYDGIEFNSFTINKNLRVSSTTCFSPFRTQHSDWMSENLDKPQPFVSLSVVPTLDKTHVSFCWFKEFSQHCSEFRLLTPESANIIELINMYIFTESEDVCVAPSLWEKLTSSERQQIYKHMGNSDTLENLPNIPLVLEAKCI
ncbi:TPA: hypothetical protein RSW77_003566 [Vibrio cholerae]|nr:hypothetical protein [Vibrio cholerae]HDZ3749684.1 hypothetical protein [Vibrio cholerae]HDZ3760529.1 hypothetical protein [Vibrio cholerae]HDZ3774998.1 hypothetical protein [Vibrio cholerae]